MRRRQGVTAATLLLASASLPCFAGTITPAKVTLTEHGTQAFSASVSSTWSSTCGQITKTGAYTAPLYATNSCKVTATPVGGGSAVSAAITVVSPIVMTPVSAETSQGGTQSFKASVPVTWVVGCGSITTSGTFTASASVNSHCTIEGIASTGIKYTVYGYDKITAPSNAGFTISPTTASLSEGATQKFAASSGATWSSTCGTITNGSYTAPLYPTTSCAVTATSTGSSSTARAAITVVSPITVSPVKGETAQGGTQLFTASVPVTWSSSCGSISAAGEYTASAAVGKSCTIEAIAKTGTKYTNYAYDVILAPNTTSLLVSPQTVSLAENGKQTFTATVPVTWNTSCGSITSAGVFTAPLTPGVCTVTATDGTGRTGTAAATSVLLNYTTFRGNNSQNGVQSQEFNLTPANVNKTNFGLKWTLALDAGIWSQPLYINALKINGTIHNVVFATTANDSVYAIDGDTGTQLWKTSFLSSGVGPVPGSLVKSSMNPIGIVGTPVIDPVAGVLYVVSDTVEQNDSAIVHKLHALNIATGKEIAAGPVVIATSGFGDAKQMQRTGLTLANGSVYVAFAGIDDQPPYNGFIFQYALNTLALQTVINTDPKSSSEGGGGIWMSATAPSVDEDGNLFVITGNGISDGVNNFGQSALKLSHSLQVMDYFTPYQHDPESLDDIDLGSGGALLVPDQKGSFPHELIVCGKAPAIYVLNRDSMGGVGSKSDTVIQEVSGQLGQTGDFRDSGHPCFTTPTLWGQNVYFIANHDVLKMFTLDPVTGLLSTTPTLHGTFNYSWPGAFASLSANGSANGIIWAYDSTTGTLRAASATDVDNELFVATVTAGSKWSVPTIVNGHVYVESANKISAFGLK